MPGGGPLQGLRVIEITGLGPAPRFSRTPAGVASGPPAPGADTAAVLRDWLGKPPETCV